MSAIGVVSRSRRSRENGEFLFHEVINFLPVSQKCVQLCCGHSIFVFCIIVIKFMNVSDRLYC